MYFVKALLKRGSKLEGEVSLASLNEDMGLLREMLGVVGKVGKVGRLDAQPRGNLVVRGPTSNSGPNTTFPTFSRHTLAFPSFARTCSPPSQLYYAAILLPLYNQTSSGQPVKGSQSRYDGHLFPRSIPDEGYFAQPWGPFSHLSRPDPGVVRRLTLFRLLCKTTTAVAVSPPIRTRGSRWDPRRARGAFGGVAMV
jgi:hypothetical protein